MDPLACRPGSTAAQPSQQLRVRCAAVVAQVVADSAAAVAAIGSEHCSDPAGDRQGFGINSKALGLSVNVVQMMEPLPETPKL